jgi:hypothetical protein
MTAAADLKTGDTFKATGSARCYTVTEVIENHRSEYAAVVEVLTPRGAISIIAFPADATVTIIK